MKIIVTLTIIFIFNFLSVANCQNNRALEQNSFMKAEAFLHENDYKNALIDLAQKKFGNTNSKILNLKIIILKSQFSQNNDNYDLLKDAIDMFFSIILQLYHIIIKVSVKIM